MAEQEQAKKISHRAIVILDERMLEQLLQLPPDIELRGTYWDAERAAFVFHLAGDRLPVCEPGTRPEHLMVRAQRHVVRQRGSRTRYAMTYDLMLGGERIGHLGFERDIAESEG